MGQGRTILFPTDFSECAQAAFEVAASLAQASGQRMLILHVLPVCLDYPNVADLVYGDDWVMADKPCEDRNNAIMKKLYLLAESRPALQVECRLAEGDPSEKILDVARETESNLIVIGTHGRTGLKRLLLGSVAEQVLRQATCPVLTVRSLPP